MGTTFFHGMNTFHQKTVASSNCFIDMWDRNKYKRALFKFFIKDIFYMKHECDVRKVIKYWS